MSDTVCFWLHLIVSQVDVAFAVLPCFISQFKRGSHRISLNWVFISLAPLSLPPLPLLCSPSLLQLPRQSACLWAFFLFLCCSVAKSPASLYDPMDCSTPGFPVLHYLPEFSQTHVYWVGDAVQTSHPLLPSSLTLNLSQHQGLFQWVGSLHQVAKVLELQHQSFQWILRVDFLYNWLVWSP